VCRCIVERHPSLWETGIFRRGRVPPGPGSQAIIAFHAPADLTSQDFGRDLVIERVAESGAFRIECAQVYVHKPSHSGEGSSCSLISLFNGPARIRYRDTGLCGARSPC
jgi:hypothetical protein